ncbi:unnamed protein product [Rotaria magnacalcarata]|uniref:Cilia-and flagella-associated protein 96 n=8 Tax=Rotaria magnacalcarata TaxID=392030 RepID=A0A816MSN7_9BILA|nr:unnamed protein product [Rotaria magnacalcarata]CAF1573607.1 unnamed protein product [Rotaria magnacalcarata]CAF1997745.1 unnamed protein product [Rotaria magnacalcarata]CAF2142237.1 unnamed protein product [Rotaria magnacalcarata]CAF2158527.1 unnamed protein product [Rotaria magnacalcarata]
MASTTKSDMDRIGLFKEMEYVTIKDPFKGAANFTFNEAAYKSKQIMSKSSKQRATGSLAGYFDTQFKLLPGSYVDPISMRRKARMEEKKKNIVSKPFVTMFRPKDPEGLGSFFGTIGGGIKDLDPSKSKYREEKKAPHEKSNFKVNPPKKGTGYGYPNVGIDKDPPYAYKDKTDNYDASLDAQRRDYTHHKSSMKAGVFKLNMHPKDYFYTNPFRDDGKGAKHHGEAKERSKSAPFDKKPFKYSSPGKSLGGNKDGCFDKFPKRSDKDPFVTGSIYSQVKNEVNKHGKTYYPNKFPKTRPTDSVINKNVNVKITRQNYKQATQNYHGFQLPQRRASVH